MKFTPENYRISDQSMQKFIDAEEIEEILNTTISTPDKVEHVIQKSLNKNRLTLQETAILIKAEDSLSIEKIKAGARKLKETIYGNRIVLFAPLYVGNKCINNCKYCGFRATNKEAIRKTLSDQEL
ncbi:MAG: [FeFe] hydrogenase H-cluster radical SAM maturase HydG, partial [Bacteroidales bacterium]|nr:[FeFe] hydrogenase H-cluster radical SAM maturase HydG [Bacteroidales bacterium]